MGNLKAFYFTQYYIFLIHEFPTFLTKYGTILKQLLEKGAFSKKLPNKTWRFVKFSIMEHKIVQNIKNHLEYCLVIKSKILSDNCKRLEYCPLTNRRRFI